MLHFIKGAARAAVSRPSSVQIQVLLTSSSSQPIRPGSRRARPVRAIVSAALFILAGLVVCPVAAPAQTKPEDLPPPPGMLERELGLPPADKEAAGAPDNAPALDNPIEIPFILEGSHIIIEASIDGTPPRPFLFDTGARHMITPEVAETLKAPVVGVSRAAGVGSKVSQINMLRVGRINIGAAMLAEQKVGVLELRNVILDRGARPRLAGLIGSELLARYAVTINYRRRTLTLHSPGYRPKGAAFSLPLKAAISSDGLSHPQIVAELDGATSDFLVDTGAGGQIFVSRQFQQEHKPFAGIGTILHILSVGGIGGHTHVEMGFAKHLRFGSFDLSPPLLVGDAEESVLGHSALAAGVIGGNTLAYFATTIDLSARRIYFEPLAVGHPFPSELYGTGLVLDKPEHQAFEVIDVLKGTSAEKAGVHTGDRIVEIDGHPARDLGIADVNNYSSKPGHAPLVIRTADQRHFSLAFTHLLP
jgi:predicted aspartyl protease